ncbi:hypothetical protein IW967_11495 [Alicyclobacillus mali]|uniref:CobQ/CobB/MinD/ParA nucleotide binding domain-containing protein n=1 Tax=Alicyclobacillus mali (ex Roth et al. 2021) TaxID=1123961 RepID=A0ABS0F5A2_9BACL|nr:hypothetical protein [Alicyclobacillus mali (ex Roth et al. 2021)]MBF8378478.1 hypothetical protein [Alicyclobacillus mali (ex Roth et al. 2021)]
MERILLYAVNGGTGRTTTVFAVTRMLANWGRRVLVVDANLDSPGATSGLVEQDKMPRYGVVDWLIDQSVSARDMVASSAWTPKPLGKIDVLPAYGRDTREYLSKVVRVHADEAWAEDIVRLVTMLEAAIEPEVVLIDGPSGLWGASLVLLLDDATVWTFLMDVESTWNTYNLLFRKWLESGLAEQVRERIKAIAAMVPLRRADGHMEALRERAWDLFRDTLYDEDWGTESVFSFDLMDDAAPHYAIPVFWVEGLMHPKSLRDISDMALDLAYAELTQELSWLKDEACVACG